MFGATSGIGLALTTALTADGDAVVAAGRRGVWDGPVAVRRVVVDVRDFDAVAATVRDAGPLDYVVNCVGVGFYAPFGSDNTVAWQEILDSNIRGLLNVVSAVLRDRPDLGHFVHVSSLAAHRISATPGNVAYSVAKAGGRTIVQELRRELREMGRATRVSMVSPGFVEGTDFGANYFRHRPAPDVGDIYGNHTNLRPPDVADVIRYVLGLPPQVEVLDIMIAPTDHGG